MFYEIDIIFMCMFSLANVICDFHSLLHFVRHLTTTFPEARRTATEGERKKCQILGATNHMAAKLIEYFSKSFCERTRKKMLFEKTQVKKKQD